MDINLILGPMFSGKTTELLRHAKKAKAVNLKVVVINHAFDIRCAENSIRTHDGVVFDAIKTDKLCSLKISEYDVVCVDEAQFFSDLKDFILVNENLTLKMHICGLDGDYLRQPFGQILDIIPLCQSVTKLNAMCSLCADGTPGAFTKRMIDCNDVVHIGAAESYISVCRKHYFV
jgi:thymidine kinase